MKSKYKLLSMRDKLKGYRITFSLCLFLFLSFIYPIRRVFSIEDISDNEQSIEFGISYLNLQKSFLDFPIVWKTTMPLGSLYYHVNIGKYFLGVSFEYGKSTYIDVNETRKWGENNFSILGFRYDFSWSNLIHGKNKRFLWGLGASLENVEINQKIEISPGKYNKYQDQYFGIGPKMNLCWKLKQTQLGIDLASILSIPYGSVGFVFSDAPFTDKSYIWWLKINTDIYFQQRFMKTLCFIIKFNREVFAFGRTHNEALKSNRIYSGGSFLLRSLQTGIKYDF